MDTLRTLLSIVLPPVGMVIELGSGPHAGPDLLMTLAGSIPALFHISAKIAQYGLSDT